VVLREASAAHASFLLKVPGDACGHYRPFGSLGQGYIAHRVERPIWLDSPPWWLLAQLAEIATLGVNNLAVLDDERGLGRARRRIASDHLGRRLSLRATHRIGRRQLRLVRNQRQLGLRDPGPDTSSDRTSCIE
jgi:hypothetical protein